MKKHFLKSFALIVMLFSAITMSATQYCEQTMKSTVGWEGNYKLTVEKVSDTQSRLTITAIDGELITGFYQFLIQNLGGGATSKQNFDPGDADFNNAELFSVAADGKSAVINVNWSTYPTGNVQVHMILRRNNSLDGSDIFGNNISDLDFSATCGTSGGGATPDPTPEPESIIESTYFAPNWSPDGVSSAAYDATTGTINVDLKSQFYGQWQAQVKVKHDVAFSADKYYQFSAKFRATQAVNGVTIKVDNNNGMIFESSSVDIPANEDFSYTSAIVKGIPGNDKIIVFDFGYASPCQITISDILLQEVDKPADTEKPVLTSATLVESSVTHNSAVLEVSATDNVKLAGIRVVDDAKNYDKTFALVDGKITLTDLTPSTTYNFTVTAVDDSGNVSEASISVSLSTIALIYCDFPTGHEGKANFGDANGRILLSLLKVSSTHIRVVVKSAAEATANLDRMYIEAAGANPHATTIGSHVATSELRELTADIYYTTAPAKYTFMIQWSNPGWDGNWQVNINDVLETNLCPLPADEEKPVMESAALVSVTHNSAILTVSATDNEEVANYHVVDETNGYEQTIAPVGNQITLTGLTPSTSYNFIVTALDMAGNESDNSKSVTAETLALLYCDFPTGHQGNANFGDANGRCLLTLTKLSDTKVRVTVKPNYENGATKKLDYLYVISSDGTPYPAEAGADIDAGGVDELSVEISYASALATYSYTVQWSNVADAGRWSTNINNVTSSNLCPLPADNEKPVMESAELVSVTHNSAILTVSATDNDEVANYHVVDATNGYDQTIAPVGNQITLTGLTPSTSYNFTVTALDMVGNESANSKSVTAETAKLEYCEWLTGHQGDANFGNANGRCLLTISKVTDKQLLVIVKPVSEAKKLDFLQVQADGAPHQTVTSPAADELSIVLDFANTITEIPLFRVLWSNEDVEGNWMVDLTNVKASYLCPHVELGESVDLSKLDLSSGITTDVKITRKFVKGSSKWNTLSLPFALNESEIDAVFGAAARVVELTDAIKTTPTDIDLTVSTVTDIVAGKPYLIQLPASYAPVVLKDMTLANITPQETATSNGLAKMVSVLAPIAFDDAAGGIRFFLNTNGKLSYRSTTNGIMNPYRAYFEFPHINDPATASQVRARVVFNENTETGVDNLITDEAPTKMIQNGQLVIIRNGIKYNVQGQKL